MTINTTTFSAFSAIDLSNSTNFLVGVSADSSGINIQVPYPLIWTTSGRPSSPIAYTLGANSSMGQYEFWDGVSWVQLAAGGSGSVNSGGANELAYYASTGTAVSGLMSANNAVLLTNSSGVPAWSMATANYILVANGGGVPGWSASLPTGLTITTPNITGITNASNATAGSVGQFVSSIVLSGSSVSCTSSSVFDLTSISLPAGDWDVWGNIFFSTSGQIVGTVSWISDISMTTPDLAYLSHNNTPATQSNASGTVGVQRFNINSTTPIYISGNTNFSTGTVTACGYIYARRIR